MLTNRFCDKPSVAYFTDTAGTFGYKSSENGVLYSTGDNKSLLWGTLPVAQGGTGATSAFDATKNLSVPYIGIGGTAIGSETNLDTDFDAVGTYYSVNSANTASLAGTIPSNLSAGFKMYTVGGYGNNYKQ